MRSNRNEIPNSFLASKERLVDTSIFAFDYLTLTSFVPKPNKSVILLSTKHHDSSIESTINKPKIIMFYNNNKGGVDTFDHLVKLNTCRRKTKRWTFNCFMFIVDCAAQNAFSLFLLKNSKNIILDRLRIRQVVLQKLALHLIKYNVQDRIEKASLNGRVLQRI
jgi:hypothetical protein